jgi:hypothetical protein
MPRPLPEGSATSPTITTETSDLAGHMGGQAAQDLPLVTRHYGDQGINTYYGSFLRVADDPPEVDTDTSQFDGSVFRVADQPRA